MDFKQCRVLLVDDDKSTLRILHDILRLHVKISLAKSGEQALGIMQKLKPSLIVSDVMMPNMNGFELVQRLHADPSTADIPIIFVTGVKGDDFKHQCFANGAKDYVTKPFNPIEVRTRVLLHLKQSLMQQSLSSR